jgi:hypothetical protein
MSVSPGQQQQQSSNVRIYSFTFSTEKGRKALVRFRENMRKYYAHCGLSKGLGIRDEPYLQLFCYDPATGTGYCRLSSTSHEGPVFPSPKKLYETYNCSSQGHINDIFLYHEPTDSDHGMELIKFLETFAITKPDDFPDDVKTVFVNLVEENKLLKAYDEALEVKRQKKAADSKNNAEKRKVLESSHRTTSLNVTTGGGADVSATAPLGNETSVVTTNGNEDNQESVAPLDDVDQDSSLPRDLSLPRNSSSTRDVPRDQANVTTNNNELDSSQSGNVGKSVNHTNSGASDPKKKPGRPKGSKGAESSTKRHKTDANVWELIPASVQSVNIKDGNLDNVSASFSYQKHNVRFGDLPPDSVEKQAISWSVFSHLVDKNLKEGFTIGPNVKAEDFLRDQLLGLVNNAHNNNNAHGPNSYGAGEERQ